jgi:mRNA interferase MazF
VICNHWQVAVVPFPFVEKPSIKRRPALVISTQEFNSTNNHTVFAMITTAKLETWPSDYALLQPQHAGLVAKSFVRWKSFTLPNELIMRVTGELADEDREALTVQARMIFIRA